tara:strand:+ start:116 stop:874 length:759 start_codon:yes stop_codon:yes gene_type:complete
VKKSFLFLFTLHFSFISFTQRNVKDSSIATPWVSIHYNGMFTYGDLAERYGYLNHLGFSSGYKLKSNWVFKTDASFIFGNQVNLTGVFDHLLDSQGTMTDVNGDIGMIYANPRGMHINLCVGKIIPVFSPNNNSGLYFNVGVGYLAHHLKIESQDQVIPSIELDYRKGYDRLTTGINVNQFIGYSFMSNSGFYNFYLGAYFQQGFTKNRRTIFFDQPDIPVSSDLMFDGQIGFLFGWLIPVYKRQPKSYYFN